jgi:hypothetical protein
MKKRKPQTTENRRRLAPSLVLCLLAAAGNMAVSLILARWGINLWLDTIFTLMVCFLAGPWWAAFTTAVHLVFPLLYENHLAAGVGLHLGGANLLLYFNGAPSLLFGLCTISAVMLAWFFSRHYRLFDDTDQGSWEPDSGGGPGGALSLIAILFTLSLYMCMVVSVTGGIISWLIPRIFNVSSESPTPESYYKLGMLLNGYPVLLAEILSRLPINIPDRLISVFGAYGAALLVRKSGMY